MIEETDILENEMDIPENWESDRILVRDGKGRVVELEIPDDEEGEADAGDY